MESQEQGRGVRANPHKKSDKDVADQVISAARRRALKAGLVTAPIILTLRSKPLFGQDCAPPSLLASATHSPAIDLTGLKSCEEEQKSLKSGQDTLDVPGRTTPNGAPWGQNNFGIPGQDNLGQPNQGNRGRPGQDNSGQSPNNNQRPGRQ